jgi:hypothetical protein
MLEYEFTGVVLWAAVKPCRTTIPIKRYNHRDYPPRLSLPLCYVTVQLHFPEKAIWHNGKLNNKIAIHHASALLFENCAVGIFAFDGLIYFMDNAKGEVFMG